MEFKASADRLNHNVFRYPAKFHFPIARRLVELFTKAGDTVLDPFCGSGTLLVEAAALGRNSVGIDVDPLAILVARAKTSLTNSEAMARVATKFDKWLEECRKLDEATCGSFEKDIDKAAFEKIRTEIDAYIPNLPKLDHWFRRRAVQQLAVIRRQIVETTTGDAQQLLLLCFASIIRNSSNADPVPVSGLEVTSHSNCSSPSASLIV